MMPELKSGRRKKKKAMREANRQSQKSRITN
jgi:hypothetical protein